MSTSPDIRIRGIRQVIPSGFILGRVGSTVAGPPQLISTRDLGTNLRQFGGLDGSSDISRRQLVAYRYTMPDPTGSPEEYLYQVQIAFPCILLSAQPTAPVCQVAPTNDVTLNISKNGVNAGNLQFSAAATVGAYGVGGGADVPFTAGDLLRFEAPNPKDPTFQGLSWTLLFLQIG